MSDEQPPDLVGTVRAQLGRWGLDAAAEGAAALDIARRLTDADKPPAPTAAAMLHGQLRALLADLRALAPEEEPSDEISDLQDEYQGLRVVGE